MQNVSKWTIEKCIHYQPAIPSTMFGVLQKGCADASVVDIIMPLLNVVVLSNAMCEIDNLSYLTSSGH